MGGAAIGRVDVEVEFSSNRLRNCYESRSAAVRQWGTVVGAKFARVVDILYSAENRGEIAAFRSFRLHPLHGAREGQWAIDLHDRWRVILSFNDETVRIEEVTQHYGD